MDRLVQQKRVIKQIKDDTTASTDHAGAGDTGAVSKENASNIPDIGNLPRPGRLREAL
jgi:hypothetical protein